MTDTLFHRLDTLARQRKRQWQERLRRSVKIVRHQIEKGLERVGYAVARAWRRSRRQVSKGAEDASKTLYRPLKVTREKLRNAPVTVRNVSRKATLYAWGLRRPVVRWRQRRKRMHQRWAAIRTEVALEREIERVTDSGGPIIIGPWMSEVGYEALYWVPFVRWFRDAHRLKPERLLVVSRGGAASWYRDITTQQADVFDFITPQAFAEYTGSRTEAGSVKQMDVSAFEQDLVARVRAEWGWTDAQVLHPSLMYRLFQQFWAGNRPLSYLDEHTRYSVVTPDPMLPPLPQLPADYVAVKLYAAQSLQDTPETRRLLTDMLASIAERYPLVLLETGMALDEHGEYAFAPSGRIISAKPWMTPRNNLAVQTQIIAGARAFVGTCGSIAWLAPMLGVDTTALMTDVRFLNVHLHVARRVYRVLQAGQFTPLDLGGLSPLGLGLAAASAPKEPVS